MHIWIGFIFIFPLWMQVRPVRTQLPSVVSTTQLTVTLLMVTAVPPKRMGQPARKMVWNTILNNQSLTAFQWIVNKFCWGSPMVHHLNFGREMYLLNHHFSPASPVVRWKTGQSQLCVLQHKFHSLAYPSTSFHWRTCPRKRMFSRSHCSNILD